jgi:hypothetical protein
MTVTLFIAMQLATIFSAGCGSEFRNRHGFRARVASSRPFKIALAELKPERSISMLLLILVLLLLFGGGGGYYGYSRWGTGGGLGIVGTVVLIAVILYFLGVLR